MKKIVVLFIGVTAMTLFSCKKDKAVIDPEETPVIVEPTRIPVGKGPDALFLTPDKTKLYVANVEDTSISIINTATEKVTGTINGIRYPWGFSRLGSTNEVAVSAYDKQIAIINYSTNAIARQHAYNSTLGGIVADGVGLFLYVIAIDFNQVYKIDASTLNVVSTFQTGNGPDGIGISSDYNKLYVTNTVDGTISIINMTTNTTTFFNTGGKPELVHANHDNTKLFISNFNDNKVHIINTVTDVIEHEITGLDGPERSGPFQ